MLSDGYAAASNDIERASFIVAAHFPSAILASRLALVCAIGTLSFGILIIGFVGLRGGMSKVAA